MQQSQGNCGQVLWTVLQKCQGCCKKVRVRCRNVRFRRYARARNRKNKKKKARRWTSAVDTWALRRCAPSGFRASHQAARFACVLTLRASIPSASARCACCALRLPSSCPPSAAATASAGGNNNDPPITPPLGLAAPDPRGGALPLPRRVPSRGGLRAPRCLGHVWRHPHPFSD